MDPSAGKLTLRAVNRELLSLLRTAPAGATPGSQAHYSDTGSIALSPDSSLAELASGYYTHKKLDESNISDI